MTSGTTSDGGSRRPELIEQELSYTIVGCAMQVYNELGYGFVEPIYVKALEVLLRERGVAVEREFPVDVWFHGVLVGRHRLDLLVERRISVEAKATERLSEVAHVQVRSTLRPAKLKLGLVLHFGPRFSYHRVLAPWLLDTPDEQRTRSGAV